MSERSDQPDRETFTDFKNSFAYGTRSDLNFKFLKNLSDGDAAAFLQGLLHDVSDAFDDGSLQRLYDHVAGWQARAYAGPSRWVYAQGPFAPLAKPLAAARVALLTSSGHFVDGDDPEPFGIKDMTQTEAAARIDDFLKVEPVLSVIPAATPEAQLRVRHGGYDVRSAQADPNVVFPLTRLRDLAHAGVIGELAPNAYSFVGACAQLPLLKRTGPKWVELLRMQEVDAAVLVPV
jgi:D-proline reductase (dithiol) PrdB